jgi:hypothetical protein
VQAEILDKNIQCVKAIIHDFAASRYNY